MIQQILPAELIVAHQVLFTLILLGSLFRLLLPVSADRQQLLEQIASSILITTYSD
jgi:Mg/Co/Ni transporter MgtE